MGAPFRNIHIHLDPSFLVNILVALAGTKNHLKKERAPRKHEEEGKKGRVSIPQYTQILPSP